MDIRRMTFPGATSGVCEELRLDSSCWETSCTFFSITYLNEPEARKKCQPCKCGLYHELGGRCGKFKREEK